VPPVVLLDACVLYPAPLRDLLMWSATTGVLSARWSAEILGEWVENLLVNRPDLKRERLERTCAEMNRAVPDAQVSGYEPLVPTLSLPDPDDRHVLAAAITGGAEVVLTLNLKDFPGDRLPEGVSAVAPDDFLCRVFDHNPAALLQTMTAHRASLTRPPKSAEEYVESLRNGGLIELTHRVTAWLDQI
jgi:predicted nucleic acid-binding protein